MSEISNEIKNESKPKNLFEKISNLMSNENHNLVGIENKISIPNYESNPESSIKNEAKYSFVLADISWNVIFGITEIPDKGLYKLEYNDEESKRPDSKEKNIRILIYKDHPLIVRFCNENEQAFEILTSILS